MTENFCIRVDNHIDSILYQTTLCTREGLDEFILKSLTQFNATSTGNQCSLDTQEYFFYVNPKQKTFLKNMILNKMKEEGLEQYVKII